MSDTRTTRILARFDDAADADRAMKKVVAPELGRRAEMLPAPIRSRGFDRRRLVWASLGALVGAAAGALCTAAVTHLVVVDEGPVIAGPADGMVLGALLGAALLGTLGLLAGLAVGEAKGPRGEAIDQLRAHERGEASTSAVLVRVELPSGSLGARARRIRRLLRDAGGRLIGRGSRSPLPDVRPLATIPPEASERAAPAGG